MPEDNTPDRTRQSFPGISSRAYEHPADRAALTALRKAEGFGEVFKKLNSIIKEPNGRLALLAERILGVEPLTLLTTFTGIRL